MRFKVKRTALEEGLKQVVIVPVINVILLLLAFFILTCGFVIQPAITIDLPRAVTSEAVNPENIEMVVTAQGAVYLDGTIINAQEMKGLFRQIAKRNSSLMIKADKNASLDRIVQISDMAREQGISRINIATNQG